ncbi:hypothetical protein F5X96DRAFT_314348 [Biscogniauxia mediterranea]|nr:hypothetical protein F5X96DRAFT_314348 [Biscogniauxia mediterranea]
MAAEDDPRVRYGLSCPVGGEISICADAEDRFLGCCDIAEACSSSGGGSGSGGGNCSGAHLFPASFSSARYSDFLPQNCAAPYNESYWYTCADAVPPFIGCCRNNPCNGGCLEGNLIPARLSDIDENAAQFLAPAATTTAAGEESASGPRNTGLIVGLSMTGVVILLAVLGIYLWWRRREERRRVQGQGQESPPDSDGEADEQQQRQQQSEMTTRPPSTLAKDMLSPTNTNTNNTPATAYSSPYLDQGGFAFAPGTKSRTSPALSSPRTPGGSGSGTGSWAPSDAHFVRSGHASQLSELSADDYWIQMHDRMTTNTAAGAGGGFQPVQELEGSEVPKPLPREHHPYPYYPRRTQQHEGGYGYQQVRQEYESG